MKVGIVGLPGAGKTTLFRALTGLPPQEGRKPNLGVIKVPDQRIDQLSAAYRPRKTTYAEIAFVDYPPPVGTQGHALDAQGIAAMRQADALAQVVRGFDSDLHPQTRDPVVEAKNLWAELLIADLQVVEKRVERLRKDRSNPRELEIQERIQAALEEERPLRRLDLTPEESKLIAGYGFLTQKHLLTVLNVSEDALGAPLPAELLNACAAEGAQLMSLSCQVEMEVAELDPEEQHQFLAELGLAESARTAFVRAAYGLADLIAYFTVGEDEVRAWPIRRGTTAVRAAGKIHSDIERGFIRAEVVSYEDRITLGSEAKCREAGRFRLEGKEYVVQDGDIMNFRFNA